MYWKIQISRKAPISQDLKRGEQKTEQEQCNHIPSSNHYQQIFPNQKSFSCLIHAFDDDRAHF
jgi:hypothetical protein